MSIRFICNGPSIDREEAILRLTQPHARIGLDIEYVSLDNPLPLGIGIALSSELGYYFFNPRDELVKQVVETSPLLLLQNAASDVPILERLGIKVPHWEDTMLLAYSAGILEKGLDDLSQNVLHKPCPKVTSQWRKPNQGNIAIDHVKLGGMCIIHACNTYALWDALPKTALYAEIDRPMIDLVLEMEKWGLLIDQFMLTQVEQSTIAKTGPMEQELLAELGVENLGSNPQVADALRRLGIVGTRKTKSAKDSVGEESLKGLDLPLTNKLLKWRSLMKTLSTYVPAMRSVDSSGRIHTSFGYTNTGRFSSSGPNLQNMTRNERFTE